MVIVSSAFESEFLKQELEQLSENGKQTRLSCWIMYVVCKKTIVKMFCHKCQVWFFLYEKLFGIFTLSAFSPLPSLLCFPTHPTNYSH